MSRDQRERHWHVLLRLFLLLILGYFCFADDMSVKIFMVLSAAKKTNAFADHRHNASDFLKYIRKGTAMRSIKILFLFTSVWAFPTHANGCVHYLSSNQSKKGFPRHQHNVLDIVRTFQVDKWTEVETSFIKIKVLFISVLNFSF